MLIVSGGASVSCKDVNFKLKRHPRARRSTTLGGGKAQREDADDAAAPNSEGVDWACGWLCGGGDANQKWIKTYIHEIYLMHNIEGMVTHAQPSGQCNKHVQRITKTFSMSVTNKLGSEEVKFLGEASWFLFPLLTGWPPSMSWHSHCSLHWRLTRQFCTVDHMNSGSTAVGQSINEFLLCTVRIHYNNIHY